MEEHNKPNEQESTDRLVTYTEAQARWAELFELYGGFENPSPDPELYLIVAARFPNDAGMPVPLYCPAEVAVRLGKLAEMDSRYPGILDEANVYYENFYKSMEGVSIVVPPKVNNKPER